MTGASSAPPTSRRATSVATTVTGERRKLHHRSLSASRAKRPARLGCVGVPASVTMAPHYAALDAEPWIDHVVEQVDDEVDDDEEEGDQHQIGGHHRDVGEADRLDDE